MNEPVGGSVEAGVVEGADQAEAQRVSLQAALAQLLSADRAIADQELLIAGIVQVLGLGPRTTDELRRELLRIWPGTGLSDERVQQALESAVGAGLIVPTVALDGSGPWTLSADGLLELQLTRSWPSEMHTRFVAQVRKAAVDAFGSDPGLDQAQRWADLLQRAIRAGLDRQPVYQGRVEVVSDGLVPASVDVARVKRQLNVAEARAEVREFLYGCIEAALDMTDSFGAEVVTVTVVQFVLHATVGRQDLAHPSGAMGSLTGQRAVLDTPILLRLLGPQATAEPTRRAITAAVQAELDVVVCEHSVEELMDAVAYARDNSLPADRAQMSAAEAGAYGRLIDSDIVSLAATAIGEGRYPDWESFEVAAADVRLLLASLGVAVREHGNNDAATVAKCRAALEAELGKRDRRRSARTLDRDANTMALAWRVRRRDARQGGWPGAWVVTTDRFMSPAMASIERGAAAWPFTLSLAQLGAVIARCADVPDLAELTRATAALAAQDAAEALACRYPPKVAAELARSLVGGGAGNQADVRVAQAGFAGVLSDSTTSDPTTMVSRVLSARQRRMNLGNDNHTRLLHAASVAAQDQAQAREAELRHEREKQSQLALELAEARNARKAVEDQLAERDVAAAESAAAQRRRSFAHAVLGAHAVAMVALLVLALWAALALVAVSAIWLSIRLSAWARDGKNRLIEVLIAGVPDVLSVGAVVWALMKK